MDNNNVGKKMGLGYEAIREGYEGSVMLRMEGRAGAHSPKGAPGNALEIIANDKNNFSNMLKPGTVTKLTKSSTAPQVDAVTMQSGRVIERIQYKDTVSPSGVQKTINQVKSGKYQQAQLRGTIEASEKYNAAAKAQGVGKTMKSTGISHNTTQRVGDKFTGQPLNSSGLRDAVKGSTTIAAGLTAGIEVIKSIDNGDSIGECTGHVISKCSESALSTGAATIAGEAVTSATTAILTGTGAPLIVPVLAGLGAAMLVGGTVGSISDGMFDDITDTVGDVIDDVVDNVADHVEDLLCDISCGLSDLFSWF